MKRLVCLFLCLVLCVSLFIVPVHGATSVKRGLRGDADSDDFLTISDVTFLQRYLVGSSRSSFDVFAADFDGNGAIEISDATLLQRYLAHMMLPGDLSKLRYIEYDNPDNSKHDLSDAGSFLIGDADSKTVVLNGIPFSADDKVELCADLLGKDGFSSFEDKYQLFDVFDDVSYKTNTLSYDTDVTCYTATYTKTGFSDFKLVMDCRVSSFASGKNKSEDYFEYDISTAGSLNSCSVVLDVPASWDNLFYVDAPGRDTIVHNSFHFDSFYDIADYLGLSVDDAVRLVPKDRGGFEMSFANEPGWQTSESNSSAVDGDKVFLTEYSNEFYKKQGLTISSDMESMAFAVSFSSDDDYFRQTFDCDASSVPYPSYVDTRIREKDHRVVDLAFSDGHFAHGHYELSWYDSIDATNAELI